MGGLYTAVESGTQQIAKKTLIEMLEIATKYPDNSEAQEYLEDAKNIYAFDYENDIFWEQKKEPVKVINKNCFALIDTETTWDNKVMTLGVVIADQQTYIPELLKYYVFSPEYKEGGMYSFEVPLDNDNISKECNRNEAVQEIKNYFTQYGVQAIYAYNAKFDESKLPELDGYDWLDIMELASKKQYNHWIP